MRVVIFQGGLGNQLFQYVYYVYLKRKKGGRLYSYYRRQGHHGFEIQKYFDVKIRTSLFLSFLVRVLERFRFLYHSDFVLRFYVSETKGKSKCAFIHDDFWQDKKYFDHVDIPFRPFMLSDRNRAIQEKMLEGNSVAIHIRRGDYLDPVFVSWYVHLHDTDYYQQAIAYLKGRFEHCTYYFFSDDIEWVREHFAIEGACYIDWNKGNDSVLDMYLMSLAKINIIANSTFSFWAARLNKRAELIIYPLRWYSEECGFVNPDIFPQGWIGL